MLDHEDFPFFKHSVSKDAIVVKNFMIYRYTKFISDKTQKNMSLTKKEHFLKLIYFFRKETSFNIINKLKVQRSIH